MKTETLQLEWFEEKGTEMKFNKEKSRQIYIYKSNRKTLIFKLFLNKILWMNFIQYWYIFWQWDILEYLFVIVKNCIWIMYNKMCIQIGPE